MLANLKQTAELVEFFRTEGKEVAFKKGEFIIRPGESPPAVFYIYQGLVKAYDITKYGEENMLIIRKEHEIFPLIWALTGQERNVIYEALVPSVTWQVSREHFMEHVTKESDMLAPLLDMTLEMYRIHGERIMNLEYRSVRERIVSFLLTTSRRFGHNGAKGLTITVPLRHQDIASSINASRETVSRELAAMERKGLIKSEQSLVTLTDIDGLRDYLRH